MIIMFGTYALCFVVTVVDVLRHIDISTIDKAQGIEMNTDKMASIVIKKIKRSNVFKFTKKYSRKM